MRYENPLYMAEEAAAADLISGGRLQLGVSRGSPETALNGSHAFGFVPAEGETDADLARRKTELFRAAIAGEPVVQCGSGDGAGRERSRSSRSRPASTSASGGDPEHGRPRDGPPSRA